MNARVRLTRHKVKQALIDNYANVSAAARALKCTRASIYRYIHRYPDVKEALTSGRRRFVDLAQAQLIRQITEANDGLGDPQQTRFVLETWGKDDGWTKRREHTGADGAPLTLALKPATRDYLAKSGKDPLRLLDGFVAALDDEIAAMADDDG